MIKLHLHKLKHLLDLLRQLPIQTKRLETLQQNFKILQEDLFSCKAAIKHLTKQPIHVVFVCHSPNIWGKLYPVYQSLKSDARFKITIVSVPFSHDNFSESGYYDGGMTSYLRKELGIEPILGYDSHTDTWINLQDLKPDYVFFQTPYDLQFPPSFRSASVSAYSRICYVPYYGIMLYKGEVDAITHPLKFFRNVAMTFVAHENEKNDILGRFPDVLADSNVLISGSPMIDRIMEFGTATGSAWNLSKDSKIKRILWTPRWRTEENNCHFFDHKDYFINLARNNADVDFLFRPHPLCLKNFLATGELSESDLTSMISEYQSLPNANIDYSDDYHDLFLSSDILVSDMSSMIAEYFVTGKPVVYTHRTNSFNEFGRELSRGFYWVRSQQELDDTLTALRNGDDPLRELRSEIIRDQFQALPGGAATAIKELLAARFHIEASLIPSDGN